MKYQLFYFPLKGRGEISRLTFALAGVDYENSTIEFKDWPAKKPTTPSGTLPYLNVEGRGFITQSAAIAKYIARENGLLGTDGFEEARIDMLLGCFADVVNPYFQAYFDKDEEKRAAGLAKVKDEIMPTTLGNMEKLCAGEFFIGNKMSLADLAIYDFFDQMKHSITNEDNYPKLKAIAEKVAEVPAVAKYLEQRPKTDL